MLYVVYAEESGNLICVGVPTNIECEATKHVKEAYGGWVDCFVFTNPPITGPVHSLKEIKDAYHN